jgi:hypothetical protein
VHGRHEDHVQLRGQDGLQYAARPMRHPRRYDVQLLLHGEWHGRMLLLSDYGMCKCEMTSDGCCILCTSGDKACCDMIQACCDCMSTMMKSGCTCYILMNNMPVCCCC